MKKNIKPIKQALYNWLMIGTQDLPNLLKRRHIVINAITTAIPVWAVIYASALLLINPSGFLIPIIFLVSGAPLFLLTPFILKKNTTIGGLYNLSLWIGSESILCYLLGRESGVHFFFLAGSTLAILIFGVEMNKISIFSMTIGLLGFIVSNHFFQTHSPYLDVSIQDIKILFYISILIFFSVIFIIIFYAFTQIHTAEKKLAKKHEYSEKLLSAMLPNFIAEELKKNRHKTIAVSHENVSIIFADLSGFTKKSTQHAPQEVIEFLNILFTQFDKLAHKHGIEKIKTLGDSYMAAAGLDENQKNHLERSAYFACDLLKMIKQFSQKQKEAFDLRIGLHSGPVMAGVIGQDRPFYDVWGETVNVAAHLESQGSIGKIQVTSATAEKLKHSFVTKKRGIIPIKGMGKQELWYIVSKKI